MDNYHIVTLAHKVCNFLTCRKAEVESQTRESPSAPRATNPARFRPSRSAMLRLREIGAVISAEKRNKNTGRQRRGSDSHVGTPRTENVSGRMPGIDGVPRSTSAVMSRYMTANLRSQKGERGTEDGCLIIHGVAVQSEC